MPAAEQNYTQIEKELSALLFTIKKFHQYTHGVQVQMDRKPLEVMLSKSLGQAPAPLQCMLLQLQKYDVSLQHVPGKEMFIADSWSRVALANTQ